MTHELHTRSELRQLVLQRCRARCEACGEPMIDFELHHRRATGQGGVDCLCNVVDLHPRCHTQGRRAVHDRPRWARERGLIVPSWHDSETTPLVLLRRFTVESVLLSCSIPAYLS